MVFQVKHFYGFLETFVVASASSHATQNWLDVTDLKITCLKSTIETLEKGVEYVQSFNSKSTRTYFCCFYC